ISEMEGSISSYSDVQEDYAVKELGEAIGRFLRTLSERDRDIFVAKYYFVSSVDEISEKLGLSSKYVWNILARTRIKLKNFLEKEGYSI
ncbi:MAG: RNA polymerase subunit sigma-70, partial [Clostridia bacterium]|nr:RNA polymerase subunit sigma-70 [Clostridia bacterium]